MPRVRPSSARPLWHWVGVFCAVLAAAGNYSVANAQRAGETDDQTALAAPRIGLHGASGVALPQPLAPSEAARVRRIFALQASGNVAEAARESERLENPLLLGAILADRYLGGYYKPSTMELSAWLARFGDEPEAASIQALLDRLVPIPTTATDQASPERAAHRGRKAASPAQARALFIANRDADAVAAAEPLLSRGANGVEASDSLLAGGLSALRLNDLQMARALFEAAYHGAASQTQRATAAFWAARSEQRQRDRGAAAGWLRLAAQENDTFYGAIARRALGPSLACTTGETVGTADVEALLEAPAGRRAFALLQVGEKRRAEAELRVLWLDAGQDPAYARPLSLVARATGLTQLATEVQPDATGYRRAAEGDLPGLRPEGGFTVDPSLVYALVRHESNFRPTVTSRSGARGLMQIMPVTARAVGAQAGHLHDPGANLAIGQRYIVMLSEDDTVDGDLIRLLAGYGQGLYGMKRWADAVRDDGDPLMFLEAIPNPHTRSFIEEALSYSWRYAAQLHVPTTSLDDLAAGRHPRLVRLDGRQPAKSCQR